MTELVQPLLWRSAISLCVQEALLVLTWGVPKKMHAFVAIEIKNESLSTAFRAREYRNACSY